MIRVDLAVQTEATYTFDDLNRIQSVTDENLAVTNFDYETIGLLSSISRPNGVTTTYTYDPQRYFVDQIEHVEGVNQLGLYQYTYDNIGNRLSMDVTNSLGTTEHDYDYDLAYRLVEETIDNTITTEYQYDRAGNRTRMINSAGITRYEYNKNDELEHVYLPDHYYENYEYDARGNLIQIEKGGHGNATFTHYDYNARDQLISYEMSGSPTPTTPTITYDYDHKDNRIGQTVAGSTTDYLWDEFSQYGDVLLETGLATRSYTLAGGMLVSQTNGTSTDYFLTDAQNSTIGIADSTGTLTSEYNYDAFGNLDSSIDPLTLETSYLYTGQQFDPIYTEMYSLRARYYDPSNGRFVSRDTWAYDLGNPFELNRYVYTANNPTTYIDPSGHFVEISTATFRSIGTAGILYGVGYVAYKYLGPLLSAYISHWDDLLSGNSSGSGTGSGSGSGSDDGDTGSGSSSGNGLNNPVLGFMQNALDITGGVAGVFLGYDSLSNSLDNIHDPNNSLPRKAYAFFWATLNTMLGVSAVNSLVNGLRNMGAYTFKDQITLLTQLPDDILRRLIVGVDDASTITLQHSPNIADDSYVAFRRLGEQVIEFADDTPSVTAIQHEIVHVTQEFGSGLGQPIVRGLQQLSVFATSRSGLQSLLRSPLYFLNPVELQAFAIAGNVNQMAASSVIYNIRWVACRAYDIGNYSPPIDVC